MYFRNKCRKNFDSIENWICFLVTLVDLFAQDLPFFSFFGLDGFNDLDGCSIRATWERYPQKWFASRPPVIFREQDSDNGAQTTLS